MSTSAQQSVEARVVDAAASQVDDTESQNVDASASQDKTPRWTVAPRRMIGVAVAISVALVVSLLARAFRPEPTLPIIAHMPDFQLTDQNARPFSPKNLSGRTWVADFIFTHCTESCPRLTGQMRELQSKFAGDGALSLVSFSVDPENDTPPVLAAYAARAGADSRWSFATGAADDVKKVVVDGFKITAEREERGASETAILHGNWFVLGDKNGNIRGYYPVDTPEDIDVLVHDIKRLEREG